VLRPPQAGEPDGNDATLVEAAQRGDAAVRERLIAAYTPLVLRTGSRLCGRYLQPGRDDEVSVGLLALNEAVDRWRRDQGASFRSFAEIVVRRRLIDHFRREAARHEVPVSEFEQVEDDGNVWNPLDAAQALAIERDRREAEDRRADIARFSAILRPYGISLQDLVRCSPRHGDARARAVAVARAVAARPEWAEYLRRHRALPLRELEAQRDLQVSRKTMERQRKFIIAVALILLEGLESLRAYVPGA
jgi:RNA polymerase sigma factor